MVLPPLPLPSLLNISCTWIFLCFLSFSENEGWFDSFGSAQYRPVSDLCYSVARFIAVGGSLHTYYMWAGGNNFGAFIVHQLARLAGSASADDGYCLVRICAAYSSLDISHPLCISSAFRFFNANSFSPSLRVRFYALVNEDKYLNFFLHIIFCCRQKLKILQFILAFLCCKN